MDDRNLHRWRCLADDIESGEHGAHGVCVYYPDGTLAAECYPNEKQWPESVTGGELAQFMATAPTMVPALIAEVRRLRAALALCTADTLPPEAP
jgi:hypothetical protein